MKTTSARRNTVSFQLNYWHVCRVKNMQADLAERDSLIRVLQHHSSLSRASSISSLLASSHCASPRLSPQQQHRSPASLVLHAGSKPSSGASSRQGSQLSTGSLSLNKISKFGLYTDSGSFHLLLICLHYLISSVKFFTSVVVSCSAK